jgi:hypothetical protein
MHPDGNFSDWLDADQSGKFLSSRAINRANLKLRREGSSKEIESIIHREKLPQESEMINEFNVCWSQYRKLDETILDLATQNTNLKAQKISARQGAQEMERF